MGQEVGSSAPTEAACPAVRPPRRAPLVPSRGDFWQGLQTPEREGQGAVREGAPPAALGLQARGVPKGVAALGHGARDMVWAAASVPSAAGWVLLGAFQRERGFLTPVTFTSWAAALEPGVCVCLFFHCVLAVVSSSPPRSMSVACLL